MVANGGIRTAVDQKAGKLLYRSCLNSPGTYYASPVAAGGKVLTTSSEGIVTVFADGPEMKILARSDLADRISGTPALLEGRIYIRSATALWAFGEK